MNEKIHLRYFQHLRCGPFLSSSEMILKVFGKVITVLIFITVFHEYSAQEEVKKAVQLPEFVISADDSFDSDDFTDHVLNDSSFYQAFINLKYIPHRFTSELQVRNRGSKEKGSLDRVARQTLESKKRVVDIIMEETNGKVYKANGYHKYLTAEMYDEVFFPKTPEPVQPTIARFEQEETKESKLDKYKL